MRPVRPICGVLVAALAFAAVPPPARADFKVFQPDAEYGETAVEIVGDAGFDPLSRRNGEQSFVEEVERGVTPFWRMELELEADREAGPDRPTNFTQFTWENVFQFTQRGEHFMDSGFFFEYGQSILPDTPHETTFGPIFRKEIFRTIDTVNLFFEKDIGSAAGGRLNFSYRWETRIALGTAIEPGFQAYGEPGAFGHFAPLGRQDHRIGPQLFGAMATLGPGSLKWNAGILFGLTPAAPRETIRWQMEYELHF